MSDRELVVGTLGAGFIGSFHSYSFAMQTLVRNRLPVTIRLKRIVDLDAAARTEVQDRFGYEETGDDWRAMLDGAGIGVFVNAAPNNLHREPAVEAARRGIPVLCEKPLAHDADASFAMWREAAAAGIVHQAAFIHRFIPAIRYMRELIRGGTLGEPVHFRSSYLMSDYLRPDLPMGWRLDRAAAGTGTLGDLGSHHIDTARYLVGEIAEVMAVARVNVPEVDGRRIEVGRRLRLHRHLRERHGRHHPGLPGCGRIRPLRQHRGRLHRRLAALPGRQAERTSDRRGPRPGVPHHPGRQARPSARRLLVGRAACRAATRSAGSSASCTRSTTSSAR